MSNATLRIHCKIIITIKLNKLCDFLADLHTSRVRIFCKMKRQKKNTFLINNLLKR